MNSWKNKIIVMGLVLLIVMIGCKDDERSPQPVIPAGKVIGITTDQAMYATGQSVSFSITESVPATVKVRYKHMHNVVSEMPLPGKSWTWMPPAEDYKGYMAELYDVIEGKEFIYGSIAVDVSSDWAKFPRYGFLSKFPDMTNAQMKEVIDNLNRHHINGIQFYDWHYKHHKPLAGTASDPHLVWKDIINRSIYFNTVKGYIDLAHARNMKAMFYNLAFGAFADAATDGVQSNWYLFKDQNHVTIDKHPLPQPPFISDIYLVDPSNSEWQNYLAQQNDDVYSVFDFDGFHIDQLGNRGNLYDYNGNTVHLPSTYEPFISAMKAAHPTKRLVMNAVEQYGREGIADAQTDFLYAELWGDNEEFRDLAETIQENDLHTNGEKKTILAAYVNYNLAENEGYFNTASVLYCNAAIFAWGGAHLELGEHMLGKEYFPNANLKMRGDLKTALVKYYDFMVAYENLLRDGGTINSPQIISPDGKASVQSWPPQLGKISVFGKQVGTRQVIHLLNYNNAKTTRWRDTDGIQTPPNTLKNFRLEVTTASTVKRIWMASPDLNEATSIDIPFTQTGDKISFSVPEIRYWSMLVIEY